jgi:hypothetical protein
MGFFALFFLCLAPITRKSFGPGPSKKIHEKMRKKGLTGSWPSIVYIEGSEQKFDLLYISI